MILIFVKKINEKSGDFFSNGKNSTYPKRSLIFFQILNFFYRNTFFYIIFIFKGAIDYLHFEKLRNWKILFCIFKKYQYIDFLKNGFKNLNFFQNFLKILLFF